MSHEYSFYIDQFHNEHDLFKKADIVQYLRRDQEVSVHEIARMLGLHPSYISHYLRLQKLPGIIVDGYYGKFISKSHLFILTRLPDQNSMIAVYEDVLARSLTSIQTEEIVRHTLYGISSKGEYVPTEEAKAFEQRMKEKDSSVQTKIIQSRTRGKICIETTGDLTKTSTMLRTVMQILSNEYPITHSKAKGKTGRDRT